MLVESNLVISKALKIYAMEMTVPQINPNIIIMDMHKKAAEMLIIVLIIISKHWHTQQKSLVKWTAVYPNDEKLSNEKQYMLTDVEIFSKTIPFKDQFPQITPKAWYQCVRI